VHAAVTDTWGVAILPPGVWQAWCHTWGMGALLASSQVLLTPNISLVGFIAETIRFLVTQCSFHGLFSVDQFNGKLGFNYSSLWVSLLIL
jgi:hypothetical protein